MGQGGDVARFECEAQFSVPLIARLMEDYPSAIFDCGGDDLVGWTDEQRKEIKDGLATLELEHIAAILPFSDIEKCRSYYASRDGLCALNELFLENPSYFADCQQGILY